MKPQKGTLDMFHVTAFFLKVYFYTSTCIYIYAYRQRCMYTYIYIYALHEFPNCIGQSLPADSQFFHWNSETKQPVMPRNRMNCQSGCYH